MLRIYYWKMCHFQNDVSKCQDCDTFSGQGSIWAMAEFLKDRHLESLPKKHKRNKSQYAKVLCDRFKVSWQYFVAEKRMLCEVLAVVIVSSIFVLKVYNNIYINII